jgi:hypothetical protein
MADNKNGKPRTHRAWAIQQQHARGGKTFTRSLVIGAGRIEGNRAFIFLDREPRGGFGGFVQLLPKGERPGPSPPPDEGDDDEAAGDAGGEEI